MLTNTFHHIPGIGIKKEENLWKSGITSWESLKGNPPPALPAKLSATLNQHIEVSLAHIKKKNFGYFRDLLPSSLHWRFFPEFRSSTVYIDIETTGMEPLYDRITTIALYDGTAIKYFVNGQNLDSFPEALSRYKTIVSYNGKSFDVPFIERFFNITVTQVHMDLRYLLKSLGYSGGLKGCERAAGIDRGELSGVDGFFAVQLWQDYRKTGDPKVLETLLAYNIEDVVNLEQLMVMAYNMKIEETPFGTTRRLPAPSFPELPFQPDKATLARLKGIH
ncbi:MAG: ribonuclease H-like domain-containing protein [Desulfobacteraceae bacterium]